MKGYKACKVFRDGFFSIRCLQSRDIEPDFIFYCPEIVKYEIGKKTFPNFEQGKLMVFNSKENLMKFMIESCYINCEEVKMFECYYEPAEIQDLSEVYRKEKYGKKDGKYAEWFCGTVLANWVELQLEVM